MTLPRHLRVLTIMSAVFGLLYAVVAVYYAYLNVIPPVARPGDLYLGDGTGFLLGALAGIPALVLLSAAGLIPLLWKRGKRAETTPAVTTATFAWAGPALVVLALAL